MTVISTKKRRKGKIVGQGRSRSVARLRTIAGEQRKAMTPGRGTGLAPTTSGDGGGMKLRNLRQQIQDAVARGSPVTLVQSEAEALVEVAEAASTMFETTLDRDVARRRMERLQVALARLVEQR